MKTQKLFKGFLAVLLTVATLFSVSCNNNGKEEETTVDQLTDITPVTDPSNPNEEPNAPAFLELVEELKPVAAWSCDGETGSTTVTELVSGRTDTLVGATLMEGHDGQGIRTYPDQKSYLDVGVGTLGKLANGKEVVSVSMWILPYISSSLTYRLLTLNVDGSNEGITVDYKSNSLKISARSSKSGSLTYKTYEYSLDDGTVGSISKTTNEGRWQHLTVVVDFKNDNISLFVNGKRAFCTDSVSFPNDTFTLGYPTQQDTLGGSVARRVYSFNGVIDSVMMFDRAITTAEAERIYGERATGYSPVTDQRLVESLIQRLGQNLLFYEGSTELIRYGMFEKLDTSNYALAAVSQDGMLYIPKSCAVALFASSAVAGEISQNGVAYLPLDALCAANGKTLLTYGKLYMVIHADAIFDATADAFALTRMTRFFSERNTSEIACAESRTVVSESAKTYTYGEITATIGYCSCPTVAKLGNSIFMAMDTNGAKVFVFESTDGGKSFTFLSIIPDFHFATLFELNGSLYLMGSKTIKNSPDEVGIIKSTDGAKTWSEMTHFKGVGRLNAHTTSNSVLVANGRVYKAYNGRGGDGFNEGCTAYMVSAPVTADLLDPASWTLSNAISFTTDMFTNHVNGSKNTTFAYIEEGNAVLGPGGQIMAIYGLKAAPVYENHAAIFSCSADGTTMSYDRASENALIKFPGGNAKFTVRYDEKSGNYLALVNRKTEDRFWSQRNVLTLVASKDLVHWTEVGDVLVDNTVMNDYISATMHGFQYVDFIFDGEDLLLAVREAMDQADCFHNANYFTFYRLKNYANYLTN